MSTRPINLRAQRTEGKGPLTQSTRAAVPQLVTLYLTPVYYTYLEAFVDLLRRLTHRSRRPVAQPAPAPPAVASTRRPPLLSGRGL